MVSAASEIDQIWDDTWARLRRATRDRRHPFRHPVVATRCETWGVRARTVVLREADARAARVTLFTDRRSGKLDGLEIAPSLSWCFYDPRSRIQVRAESHASVHVGDALARSAWERLGPAARELYAVEPAPATPLAGRESAGVGARPDDGFENFAVVVGEIGALDWLRLDRDGHRRALFEARSGDWQGRFVVP